MPKFLIFDCDGVLVDSEIISNRIEAELKTKLGFPTTLEEQIRKFVGMGLNSAEVREELARLPADYVDRVDEEVRRAYPKELRAIDGMNEILSSSPLPRCVASSSEPEWISLKLSLTGLAPYFGQAVFSGRSVARGKPAPDLFFYAAERMGWDPKDCFVIEDSVPGVQAGVAAGMTVCGFTGASHILPGHAERLREAGAHHVIAQARELLPLLNPSSP